MSANEAAYRQAVANSLGIKQTAIRNIGGAYRMIADDVPPLVKAAAGKNPSPDDVAAAEIKVNAITAEAADGRDKMTRKAEAEHNDRLAAAGRHFGVANGVPRGSDPDAPHAQAWLRGILR